MMKISLVLGSIMMFLGACNSLEVRVTGAVQGLEGTVKLLAEMPGEKGFVLLARQEVKDGHVDLRTERLVLPAQVWIDLKGRKILDIIVDSRKETFIAGTIDSLDCLKITGSHLMSEYTRVTRTLNEKFNPDNDTHTAQLLEISQKEILTRDDEVKLGMLQSARQRIIGRRADYVKQLIGKNPVQELSLFLLKNELSDSLNAQKRLFNTLAIRNKESNIYKVLENQLK